MTNKEYIQKLLDGYMAAETTREEEKILSDYFGTHQDIPAEWRGFSVMFRGLSLTAKRPIQQKPLLRWCAAAAVVGIIIETGLLFMRREEAKVEPTAPVAALPHQIVPQVDEPQGETAVGEPAPIKRVPQSSARRHRPPKPSRPTVPTPKVAPVPHCRENFQSSPQGGMRGGLSEHRDRMRNDIQAAFGNASSFVAQTPVEL